MDDLVERLHVYSYNISEGPNGQVMTPASYIIPADALAAKDAEIAELRKIERACGKDNCFGRDIPGHKRWVRESRLLDAQAEIARLNADLRAAMNELNACKDALAQGGNIPTIAYMDGYSHGADKFRAALETERKETARLKALAEEAKTVMVRFTEQARVGSGNKPVTRSSRVNCPSGIFHDARTFLAKLEADNAD